MKKHHELFSSFGVWRRHSYQESLNDKVGMICSWTALLSHYVLTILWSLTNQTQIQIKIWWWGEQDCLMKEIKLPFEQVTVFSIHWSYLMFVIGTTGIARTKKSVLYKMQNSICFTFSGVFLVFGDVFNSFFSSKFWDSENLPVSSIRYTRGGGQISQDSIFTFPKVTESSLNLRLALRQKKNTITHQRSMILHFFVDDHHKR